MDTGQSQPAGQAPVKIARPEDLDNRRDTITKLYWDQGRELADVMRIMETQHQFKATNRQYKTAFKRWGLQKHVSAKDMRHMVRIRKRRRDEDEKPTHFSINKRRVPDEKIDRWIQRTGFEHRVAAPRNTLMSATPPNIDYKTPSEHSSVADTARTPKATKPANGSLIPRDIVDISVVPAPVFSSIGDQKLLSNGSLGNNLDATFHLSHWLTGHGAQHTALLDKTLMPPPPGSAPPSAQIPSAMSQKPPDPPGPVNKPSTHMFSGDVPVTQTVNVDMASFNHFIASSDEASQLYGLDPLQNLISDSGPRLLDPVMSQMPMSMHGGGVEVRGADSDSELGSQDDAAQATEERDFDMSNFFSQQYFVSSDQDNLGKNLRAAASKGDANAVQQILRSSYVDVDSCSVSGRTALHAAAFAGHVEILRELLHAGADVSLRVRAKDGKGSGLTAIEVAINGNQLGALELLLASFCFNTDVAGACQEEVLRHAIKHAMQKRKLECLATLVRFFGWDWNESVHYAIVKGYFYALRIFVDHEVDIDLPDEFGDYPLHAAIRQYEKKFAGDCRAQVEMIEFLVPKVAGTQRDAEGRAPIHLAASRGYDEVIRLLLKHKVDPNTRAENNQTALLYLYPAVKIPEQSIQQVAQCVAALSKAGADPSIGDKNGNTLLHYVPELARHFFKMGANMNMQNSSGETPLFLAAKYTCSRGIKALLESGADPDIKDSSGVTPLMEAVRVNNLHVAQLLIDGKADANIGDDSGQTPIFKAVKCRNLRVLQLLLKGKANPNVLDNAGATPLLVGVQYGNYHEVKALMGSGANPNSKDKNGRTPLFDAVEFGWPEIIKLLLDRGVDPNVRSRTGATALFRAVRLKKDVEAKALLDGGANPNIKDKHGRTPLIEAAMISHQPIVKLLLDGKADANLQDDKGETALHAAIRTEDDSAIIRLLRAAGAMTDVPNGKGETAKSLKEKYKQWNEELIGTLDKFESYSG